MGDEESSMGESNPPVSTGYGDTTTMSPGSDKRLASRHRSLLVY